MNKRTHNATLAARLTSRLTRNTLALILAGGRGTRLKHLTTWRAKPAVPFGGKFRIIDFPLSNCLNSGIRRVAVLTQYKAHTLIQHIQKGWGFLRGEFGEFVELWPAQQRLEGSWYSGTADAVYQNLDIIHSHNPEFVLVLAGDHIYRMDYGAMLAYHVERHADLTIAGIAVPAAQASQFGVMAVDNEGQVLRFAEKPGVPETLPGQPDLALASMGIYVISTRLLRECLILDADQPDSSHDFGKDIIPSLVGRARVYAYPFCDIIPEGKPYWRDVGTVDAYWEANMDLISITPDLNLYDPTWPIWTYQEQWPPAKFIFDDDDRRGMAVDSMVSGGCVVSGAQVKRSLLFSNVRVNSYAKLDQSVVLPHVEIGRHAQIRRAILDKHCKIPPGTVIGFDPIADQQRFCVSPQGVVLVTADMLGQELHHVR